MEDEDDECVEDEDDEKVGETALHLTLSCSPCSHGLTTCAAKISSLTRPGS